VVRKNSLHREVDHMPTGFIRYEKKDGAEYAFICKAKRVDGKKTNDVENLGRVVDRARGIYKNR